ncbi:CocE/NonD family hydrolase [Nitriliruptor alkaliphilus]|uniref:CocE/NonD family hydrolase n=1 Tax=Nitriliruptor alkaliphilus TaxID=427918 RepID=UPI0006969742|nr:CocE/NonD family hydrolase [Nitriliruptor alkaliphilus]
MPQSSRSAQPLSPRRLLALAAALALVSAVPVTSPPLLNGDPAGAEMVAAGEEDARRGGPPDGTGKPDDEGRPDGKGKPDQPGKPDRPGKPGDPGGPDDPDTPDPTLEPVDYIAIADQLSQPDYPEIVKTAEMVETFDGESIYIEVTRPDPAVHGDGPWPVILEASPYHGTIADREGIRVFPDPRDESGAPIGMTGYFAPRGYAVVMMDLRGTGRSTGCLDHLGPDDAQDLKAIVEWAADADWSSGDVGMTGHSYVGSTPTVAAAQDPRGLKTIAPSAGLASMYDHQFHSGVPWFLQWVGPMYAYEQLALDRDLPGGDNADAFPNPQFGCGLQNSAITAGHGQVTGQYQGWHAERDWREGAAAADIPIFMIHGVNDNAARIPAAEWFFADRTPRADDKTWIGQWDHGSAGNTTCSEGHVTCRFDQWKYALHAWFDLHLQGRDVPTGPSVEAFLNGESVTVAEDWQPTRAIETLYLDASDGSLATEAPAEASSASFTAIAGDGSTEFVSAPLAEDVVFLGVPQLQLDVSVTGQVVHLVTDLLVEEADGTRRRANLCAANTHLRDSVESPSPVIPGDVMSIDLQCFTQAHRVLAGERLVLSVGTTSGHHVPTFATDVQVTVHTGPDAEGYRLSVVPDAPVFADVPLREGEGDGDDGSGEPQPAGEAQGPVTDTVTVVAPGLGAVGVEPLTEASVPFEVSEGFDNARLQAVATTSLPGDIDLDLQRRTGENTWETVAVGASFDLGGETLALNRPQPGEYRLIVHNWAGPPNQVDVLIRFVNSAGEVGS